MKTDRRVLHIYSQPSPETEGIESTLAELNVRCCHATDCYAGMAELVRQGPDGYETVLVSLDGLSPGDKEFFQLVARRFRSSPIHVYGVESGEITAQWAVQAGARRRIEVDELRSMFQPRAVPLPDEEQAEPAPEPVRLDDLLLDQIVRPLEEKSAEALTEAAAERALEAGDDFQPDEIRARRSETSQMRQKPQPAHKAEPHRTPERDPASLITPEELQALLGDEAGMEDGSNLKVSGDDQ